MPKITFISDALPKECSDRAYKIGDIVDVNDRSADRWIRRGRAVIGGTVILPKESIEPVEATSIPSNPNAAPLTDPVWEEEKEEEVDKAPKRKLPRRNS